MNYIGACPDVGVVDDVVVAVVVAVVVVVVVVLAVAVAGFDVVGLSVLLKNL